MYGLTPSKAWMAAALAGGDSLEADAERAGISLNTAKMHRKNVFARTGHSRQAQLVRDVYGNPLLRVEPR